MAQHLVVGQAVSQHGLHRAHHQQALARKAAFVEQVLVDLGRRGAVGVDAALAGEQAVEAGGLLQRRQRRDDARLQDAVAAGQRAPVGGQPRLVVWVRGHAHQLAQAAGRQLGVAVQCQDVAGVGRDAGGLAQVVEGLAAAFGQRGDQLFEFAALALPTDPALLGLTEAAAAVQQQEARRRTGLLAGPIAVLIAGFGNGARVVAVQRADLARGQRQPGRVGRDFRGVGVGPVGQQRKLRLRLGVGQVVQVQPAHQRADAVLAGQHRRHHQHHPVRGWNAIVERQSRQRVGPGRFTDQAVDQRHHGFGGRNEHQPRGQRPAPRVVAGPTQQHRHECQRAQPQGGQVGRQHAATGQCAAHHRQRLAQAQLGHQCRAARAAQPVAGGRAGVVGVGAGAALHPFQQHLRHRHLAVATAPGQLLDRVQGLVAGDGLLGLEERAAQHQAHQRAASGYQCRPVGVTDGAQRAHGVAHAEVVGRLAGSLLGQHRGPVGQRGLQPIALLGRGLQAGGGAEFLQPLRHLGQKDPADTSPLQQRQQGHQRRHRQAVDAVAAQVGHFACCLVGGHPLGQPAQVFDQHHPQRGRQRPDLAQVQLAGLLVGAEKGHQQLFTERTIGVGDKGPGHAVDPRQAGQRRVQQHRQGAKVAARQAVPHLFELGLDQVEVVQQPFGRRADVIAGGGLGTDVAVRLAQCANVALQAWEKRRGARRVTVGAVCLAQAAAVLGKTLRAEDLGPYRRLGRAALTVEDVAQGGRRLRDQVLKC